MDGTTEAVVLTKHFFDKVGQKQTPKNTFLSADDRRFTVWDAGIASQLLPYVGSGQPVTLTYETEVNGQYTNLIVRSAQTNGAPPAVTQQAAAPQADSGYQRAKSPEENLRIMRQSALERAILTFGASGASPLDDIDALLELSDQFIDYFNGGRQAVSVVADETVIAGPVA